MEVHDEIEFQTDKKIFTLNDLVPESEYLLEINPLNEQGELGPKKTLKFKTTKLRSVRNYKSNLITMKTFMFP